MNFKEYMNTLTSLQKKDDEIALKLKQYFEKIHKLEQLRSVILKDISQLNKKVVNEGMFTIKFTDLIDEICKLTRVNLSDLIIEVNPRITIWGKNKSMNYIRQFTKEKNYYTDRSELSYTIASNPKQNKTSNFHISISNPLDLEKEFPDGTRLYEYIKLKNGYDDVQGCWYTDLRLDPLFIKKAYLTVKPENFTMSCNEKLLKTAVYNIIKRQEIKENINNSERS